MTHAKRGPQRRAGLATPGKAVAVSVLLLAMPMLLIGCGSRYAGSIFGSQTAGADPQAVGFTFNDYVLRFLRTEDGQRAPHAAIFWVSHSGGGAVAGSGDYDGLTLNGHLVHLPAGGPAAYALKPDYSVERLPLAPVEVDKLFWDLMSNDGGRKPPEMMLYEDPIWKDKVAPHLSVVEAPARRPGDPASP